MDIEKLRRREATKREKHTQLCELSDKDWPRCKLQIRAVFEQFIQADEDAMTNFRLSISHQPQNGKDYGWQDSAILCAPDRYLGFEYTYENREITRQDLVVERGANLVIHYTYGTALLQVFFTPPKSPIYAIEKKGVLLWHAVGTENLTRRVVCRLIQKFMIFERVETSACHSSWFERKRVRWWRFMDVRNRRAIGQEVDSLLTPWELTVLAALTAIAGSSFLSFVFTATKNFILQ
jgi:hypothetical protein